ncbi:MAG: hypothetical protein Q7S32_01520 [bacterium]|nr:hypothetical protein [bacterium]
MKKKLHNQAGVAILFSIILISILLSAAFTLSLIFAPKIRSSGQIKDSTGAFYAADSGVEWCLYMIRKGLAPAPIFNNGATLIANPADCSAFPMKLTGTYKGVTRAVEVNF